MSCFLGVDAGTSGVKVIVMDDAGQLLGSGYHECDLITPNPGYVEQDPNSWWKACDYAVAEAVKNSGRGKDVVGIGFSGQMQGVTPLDKNMELLGNCIIWLDQRATKETEEIYGMMSGDQMLDMTGNFCLNSFWAPKLLWMKKNEPEKYDKLHTVLFAKDYLRYMMTGEAAVEVSDTSLSFLMDVAGRKWSDKIFDVLGISKDVVPARMLESQDVAGQLRADLAEKWGLKAGIPVIAGGGDQPAGGVGTGIVREGILGSTIGTSGVVFCCTEKPFVDYKQRAIMTMAHSVPDKWCFLGLALASGGSYKWLRDTIFADKKAQMESEGKDIYDYMSSLAAESSPGSEGLTFLPYLNGDKTPINDADARGVFFGLSYRHGIGDICRSVMEGVTFSLRDTVEICREAGVAINEIRTNGGGAKSPLWRQIQADIYNQDVVTMNMEEGPAAGGAILAAVGAGAFASVEEACDALIKPSGVTHPIAENAKRYDEYYHIYKELYGSLKGLFKERADVVAKNM